MNWLKLAERAIVALERLAAAAEERNRILDVDHEAQAQESRNGRTRVG